MKQTLPALFLTLLPTLSAAELQDSKSDCSLEAFTAYGQTWSGLPVIPKAMLVQPTLDGISCGFAVEATLLGVEEWYQHHLVEDGWRLLERKDVERGAVLFFQRDNQTFKLTLSPSYGATIVLMHRPEPHRTMKPTR